MTSTVTGNKLPCLISGVPNPKQQLFFDSHARFTAYGGARGGGKSWALRRKLVAMCIRYAGLRCLLIRRSLTELKSNHLIPMLREYGAFLTYRATDQALIFPNGSRIDLGYCDSDRDVLRYQGQEYDVIAIDEATQFSEYRFSIFKACLRGTNPFPRRMYLTCNPGGIGHAWVKRLFVDRIYRSGERPEDYAFISAGIFDNEILLRSDPDYVETLKSLPERLRDAWLYGKWDVFEGQFFPEFDPDVHVCAPELIPRELTHYVALDYGLDRLSALLIGQDAEGNLYVLREFCRSDLTLSQAALAVQSLCEGISPYPVFAACSPDLWNRRQDSGKSGFEIMQNAAKIPPMRPADNRRIPGWRVLREYLSESADSPRLRISSICDELIRCLPALLHDRNRPEDASGEPHAVTHAPEALRYAVMSRCHTPEPSHELPFRFSDWSGERLYGETNHFLFD